MRASLMKLIFKCLDKYCVRTNKISAGLLKWTTLTFTSWLSLFLSLSPSHSFFLSPARACAECVLSSSGMGDILPGCHYLHSFMILGWPIYVGTGYTKRERNESVFHGVSFFFVLFCSFHLTFFTYPVYTGMRCGVGYMCLGLQRLYKECKVR